MPSSGKPLHLTEMLENLGVDLGASVVPRVGNALVSVSDTCEKCGVLGACRAFLAEGSEHECAPAFCPNADILAELMAEPSLRSAS